MANRKIETFDLNVENIETLRKGKNMRYTDMAVSLGIHVKTLQRYRKAKKAPRYIIKGLSRIFNMPEAVFTTNSLTELSDVYNDIRSIINEWDLAKSSLVAGDNPSKYLNMIKIIIDRFEEEHKED